MFVLKQEKPVFTLNSSYELFIGIREEAKEQIKGRSEGG